MFLCGWLLILDILLYWFGFLDLLELLAVGFYFGVVNFGFGDFVVCLKGFGVVCFLLLWLTFAFLLVYCFFVGLIVRIGWVVAGAFEFCLF